MGRNYRVKADIDNLTGNEARKMHREILRVRDEIAPKAHGHVIDFDVRNMLGFGKKKELSSGD